MNSTTLPPRPISPTRSHPFLKPLPEDEEEDEIDRLIALRFGVTTLNIQPPDNSDSESSSSSEEEDNGIDRDYIPPPPSSTAYIYRTKGAARESAKAWLESWRHRSWENDYSYLGVSRRDIMSDEILDKISIRINWTANDLIKIWKVARPFAEAILEGLRDSDVAVKKKQMEDAAAATAAKAVAAAAQAEAEAEVRRRREASASHALPRDFSSPSAVLPILATPVRTHPQLNLSNSALAQWETRKNPYIMGDSTLRALKQFSSPIPSPFFSPISMGIQGTAKRPKTSLSNTENPSSPRRPIASSSRLPLSPSRSRNGRSFTINCIAMTDLSFSQHPKGPTGTKEPQSSGLLDAVDAAMREFPTT